MCKTIACIPLTDYSSPSQLPPYQLSSTTLTKIDQIERFKPMSSKRHLDDDSDESADEDFPNFSDHSGDDETDGDASKMPDGLDDDSEDDPDYSSEDSEQVSTDEDDWQNDTDISSVESGTTSDNDQEPSSHHSMFDQPSGMDAFFVKIWPAMEQISTSITKNTTSEYSTTAKWCRTLGS